MSAHDQIPAEFSDFVYSGPIQSVQLKAKGENGEHTVFFEGTFFPGKTYTLPTNHPTISAWVCGGILKTAMEKANG
ncbi:MULTISPECIES: hypothetical protein [Stappiaceae]|uniref:hypothetical protein n=1 Tax=Stappiaceae TaxID=2821832 RepID=UPI000C998759|nr:MULTISPECIES: hypothetical protein [Pseudovibrio]MDD7908637.1 hypothetical protein [Pseudovibrio exalbescens]MDX5595317.1 hypothetical protein [Pseudovibrio sp. SPO723]